MHKAATNATFGVVVSGRIHPQQRGVSRAKGQHIIMGLGDDRHRHRFTKFMPCFDRVSTKGGGAVERPTKVASVEEHSVALCSMLVSNSSKCSKPVAVAWCWCCGSICDGGKLRLTVAKFFADGTRSRRHGHVAFLEYIVAAWSVAITQLQTRMVGSDQR